MLPRSHRRFHSTTLAITLCALSGGTTQAEELLRWEFRPGQRWQVSLVQQRTAKVALGARSVGMTIDLEMDMQWDVDRLVAAGAARMKQKVTRIALRRNSDGSDEVHYDSSGQEEPRGEAAELASFVRPLVGLEVQLTMTPRGEITDVLPGAKGTQADGDPTKGLERLFDEGEIRRLLSQAALVLPLGKASEGDTWTSSNQAPSPWGKLTRKNTYTYRGIQDYAGRTAARIDLVSQIELGNGGGQSIGKSRLTDQQQDGTLYFDPAAGHLVHSEVRQRLTSETQYRETKIVTEVQATIRTDIRAVPRD